MSRLREQRGTTGGVGIPVAVPRLVGAGVAFGLTPTFRIRGHLDAGPLSSFVPESTAEPRGTGPDPK